MERMRLFFTGTTVLCGPYNFTDERIRAGIRGNQQYRSENIVQHIQATSRRYPSCMTKPMRLGEIFSFLDPPTACFVLRMQMKMMKMRLSSRWVILDRAFHKLAGSIPVRPWTSTHPRPAFGPRRIWKHSLLGQPMYVTFLQKFISRILISPSLSAKSISWIDL